MGPRLGGVPSHYSAVRKHTKLQHIAMDLEESFGMQRLRRATPFALALALALVSGAFAGANAGATFSLTSATTISGVGPGETVTLDIAGSGFVGVKNLDLYLEVSDASNFNLTATTLTTGFGFIVPGTGQLVTGEPNQVRLGAAGLTGDVTGDGTFSVTLTTSDAFTVDTEATVTVALISIGPSSSDRDEFDAAALGLSVTVNPPVSDPTLVASTATDVSVDFSAVGSGAEADDSDGEVTLAAIFSDATGAPAAGQDITWVIDNNGAESIFIVDNGTEIEAGSSVEIVATSGSDGSTGLTLDSEGDKFSGSTSAMVTASTTAENSEGDELALSVEFSVTWDVPVPAELASFAGSVTPESNVMLQWAVSSQTNNLGWEVYRSVDDQVFERVSGLIAGNGTSDEFASFDFVDEELPLTDVVYYYLRQIDLNGTATRSQTIEVTLHPTSILEQALPMQTALSQNYPNPFNPETTIEFDLATETQVTLRVFDLTGQVVRTLVSESLPAGAYNQLWDGRNEAGMMVGSGVYFYELKDRKSVV